MRHLLAPETLLDTHLFGKLVQPLARPIFLTAIQLVPSFRHVLLIHTAYLTSAVSYKCLKRILLHFKKGTFDPQLP